MRRRLTLTLAGFGAIAMGLAFGLREWIAYVVIRLWPKAAHVPARPTLDPLGILEMGGNTAVSGRRLLTYRISKIALTIFGRQGVGGDAGRRARNPAASAAERSGICSIGTWPTPG